jgi:hypothetical protein
MRLKAGGSASEVFSNVGCGEKMDAMLLKVELWRASITQGPIKFHRRMRTKEELEEECARVRAAKGGCRGCRRRELEEECARVRAATGRV